MMPNPITPTEFFPCFEILFFKVSSFFRSGNRVARRDLLARLLRARLVG